MVEAQRVGELDQARRNDLSTMRALFGRRLESLAWPAELEMDFATEYIIEGQGNLVRMDDCLPIQDARPGIVSPPTRILSNTRSI